MLLVPVKFQTDPSEEAFTRSQGSWTRGQAVGVLARIGFGPRSQAIQGPPPVIVLVTAYERFAVRRVRSARGDYLLKPFDRERFQTALQRACERFSILSNGVWKVLVCAAAGLAV